MRKPAATLVSFLTLFMLLSAGSLFAVSPWAVWDGKTLPPAPGRVNDYAGILSAAEISELEAQSARLEDSTGHQMVFVIINSLGGRVIEDYGLFLGRGWGIGQEKSNNGVLVIASMEDRELRIEVGYGLEGDLTDIACGRIIDNLLVPAFKQGAYGQGMIDAGQAVTALLLKDASAVETYNKPEPVKRKKVGFPVGAVVFFIFIIISSLARRRRGGRFLGGFFPIGGWSSGDSGGFSSGGGGFSGGGGSFGGGGSSGSW
jgi:uncharacterized protein